MAGRFGSRTRAEGPAAASSSDGGGESGQNATSGTASAEPPAPVTGTHAAPPPPPGSGRTPPPPPTGTAPPPPPPPTAAESTVQPSAPSQGTDVSAETSPEGRSTSRRRRGRRAAETDVPRSRKAARAARAPKVPKPPFRVRSRAFWRRQRGSDAQWRLLLRAAHPRQAVLLALAIGVLAFYSDRGPGPSAVAGVAVLVVQLAAGLMNDIFDASLDRRAERARKPVATGQLPAGNASFLAVVLVLLAVPLSLQNGTLAGLALLATLPVAFVHDRILHRTPASFLGWMATFALLPVFLAYGGWGGGRHGADPTWQFVLVSAFVGLCLHLATTLPDLVGDNAAGTRSLPLVIALRIGAPRLLVGTVVLSAIVLAAFIVIGIDPGLRVPF